MSESKAIIRVEGYSVESFGADEDALNNAAQDIAGDIGAILSSLGQWSNHGRVTVEIDEMVGES